MFGEKLHAEEEEQDCDYEQFVCGLGDLLHEGQTEGRGYEFICKHLRLYSRRLAHLRKALSKRQFGRFHSSIRSAQELESEIIRMEDARNTWLLMGYLRQSENSAQGLALNGQNLPADRSTDSSCEYFSHEDIRKRIILEDQQLNRNLRVINWLEHVNQYDLQFNVNGDASLSATLLALQTGRSPAESMVTVLDPDAASRQNRQVVRQDKEQEDVLLGYVWQLLRAGKLPEAVALCASYKQSWRAASLNGGQLWHYEQEASKAASEGKDLFQGNRKRNLWKACCRRLSEAPQLSPCEQAIYGFLGGNLPQVLAHCTNWRDVLWAYFSAMCEQQIDGMLRSESSATSEAAPARTLLTSPLPFDPSFPTDPEAVFKMMASHSNISIRQRHASPYCTMQQYLILSHYDRLPMRMAETVSLWGDRSDAANASTYPSAQTLMNTPMRGLNSSFAGNSSFLGNTSFQHAGGARQTTVMTDAQPCYQHLAVHIFLYLDSLEAEHEDGIQSLEHDEQGVHGSVLLKAYISSLIASSVQIPQFQRLVALYCQFLPPDELISIYSDFLRSLSSEQLRQDNLDIGHDYFPEHIPAITRLLVHNIITTSSFSAVENTLNQTGLLLTDESFVSASGRLPTSSIYPNLNTTTLLQDQHTQLLEDEAYAANIQASDWEKIKAMDWLDAGRPGDRQEILLQANLLFRTFVVGDRVTAALKLSSHLSTKVTVNVEDLQPPAAVDAAATFLHNQWREFRCWKLYCNCLNWHQSFLSHFAARPLKPSPLSSSSLSSRQAFKSRRHQNTNNKGGAGSAQDVESVIAQQNQFDADLQTYQLELLSWQTEESRLFEMALSAFQQCFQFEHGWQCDTGDILLSHEGQTRSQQMEKVRKLCIPQLTYMLFDVCFQSKRYEHCLDIATILADEKQQLYLSWKRDELQAFLRRLSEAYLQREAQLYEAAQLQH